MGGPNTTQPAAAQPYGNVHDSYSSSSSDGAPSLVASLMRKKPKGCDGTSSVESLSPKEDASTQTDTPKASGKDFFSSAWSWVSWGWNGIHAGVQKLVSWIFCQCFRPESLSGDAELKQLFTEARLLRELGEVPDLAFCVEIFQNMPSEFQAKVRDFAKKCLDEAPENDLAILDAMHPDHPLGKLFELEYKKSSLKCFESLLERVESCPKPLDFLKSLPVDIRDFLQLADMRTEILKEFFERQISELQAEVQNLEAYFEDETLWRQDLPFEDFDYDY